MAGTCYMNLSRPALSYAATCLGYKLMSSVFGFYYVKVYLNRFHVSEEWFHVSQAIFMVWNAVNDPLFGYIQDNMNFSWVRSRRHSILYGAPFFAMAFLLPWVPWGDYTSESFLSGIQLLVMLCFWDTMFTYVLLAECALFTEMSKKTDDRIKLIRYSQVAGIIGGQSVFFCEYMSGSLSSYPTFIFCCVLLALAAWACMTYTGLTAYTEYDLHINKPHVPEEDRSDADVQEDKSSLNIWWRQTLQISKQTSFICFVLMNFCQIFHTTFLGNFLVIICDQMIPKSVISTSTRSGFYGLTFLMPQLLVILGSPLVTRFGYYNVFRAAFVTKIMLGVSLFLIGQHYMVLMVFFLLDGTCSRATFSLFNLCISDIIDHDNRIHRRKHPLSSMVYGTNALITKPAVSIAPMLTVAIFNRHGYEEVKSTATAAPSTVENLNWAMFTWTCAVPVVIGALQLVIWAFYPFKSAHRVLDEREVQSQI